MANGLAERVKRLEDPATAVVLDGRGLADLGVVRSLGRVGVEVWLAGPARRAVAAASRYVSRRVLMPPVHKDPEGYVGALASWCADQSKRLALYCTGDLTTSAVSKYRCMLPANVSHHLADAELVSTCLSKSDFAELAAERGFPVPQSRWCSDRDSLRRALEELGSPVFVKPDNRHKLWTGDAAVRRAVNGTKGFVVNGLDNVPAAVELSLEHGFSWVVQQYIPGDARDLTSVHVYRSLSGDWMQSFVGQKLRTAPPVHGVGVLVRSREDSEAAELAEGLLVQSDYRGYALLQFKRHPGSGDLQLIEINPRYSTWCELALDAGVNLPGYAYLDQHDALNGVKPVPQKDDLYWWNVSGDLSNLKRAEASWSQRLGFLRLSSRWPAFARLRLDDPRPALARLSWATHSNSWESARS